MSAPAITLVPLHAARDLDAVEAVYRRASDYLALESGLTPAAAACAFFEDRPPAGSDEPMKFGVAGEGGFLAIADLAFGYPEPNDAYIGLLLLVPEGRGRGLGRAIADEIRRLALARGASRLLVGVLDANGRGRAFWEQQGFRLTRTSGPHAFGERQHVVHRLALSLTDLPGNCI